MTRTRLLPVAILLAGLCACDETTSPTTPALPAFYLAAPSTLSLGVGTSAQIRSVVSRPGSPAEFVTTGGMWASSNTAVATVSEWGIVTGVSAGTSNVTVTVDDVTASVAVTVSASSGDAARTLWGTGAGPSGSFGTVMISIFPDSRATGTLYLSASALSLIGRLDAPASIVNVAGGGFTFFGTLTGDVLVGTLTDPAGLTWGFAAIDATRHAVSVLCGAYVSDGATGLGNPDAGAFVLANSTDGTASGASQPADASRAPLVFVGSRAGNSLALTATAGGSLTGTIQGSTATGAFLTANGSAATFSANPGVCH